jgi:hypothetical protein
LVACIADTDCVTSYEEFEPEEPRGWNPLAVALIASLVLLLGLGGALFGINVADKNRQANNRLALPDSFATSPQVTPTDTATATATATPPNPSPPPTPTASAATSAAGGSFALPDLSGLSFQDARTKVRDLKLGWRLVFEGTLADPTVRVTDPPASTPVKPGDTVKILVKGAAPLATVPDVRGLPCSEAVARIVDAGLYPDYQTGRDGVVLSQNPTAIAPKTLRWNDQLQIRCGQA